MGTITNGKGAENLEKCPCFFQISKNHNSVNFCHRQKSYLKKSFGISFSIKKKIKKGGYKIEGRRRGSLNPIRRWSQKAPRKKTPRDKSPAEISPP